jgi:two-component SAPR family response regulator
MLRILLVDDEPLQLLRLNNSVCAALEGQEVDIHSFGDPLEAAEEAKKNAFDIAFLDISLPSINGVALAKKIKETNPSTNIIFVTAYDEYAMDALNLHASGYILKPVNANKVKAELNDLRYLDSKKKDKLVTVKCFGNFEVFARGEPLSFRRSKSKELFAYLVDREGASVTMGELNAILWEEDHSAYLRNLVADIQNALKAAGVEGVFVKRHNECFVDVEKIDCDAYEYHKGNKEAIASYRGEYMAQYSWAIFDANDFYKN